MCVVDEQFHAAQPAAGGAAQEVEPERPSSGVADRQAEDLAAPMTAVAAQGAPLCSAKGLRFAPRSSHTTTRDATGALARATIAEPKSGRLD